MDLRTSLKSFRNHFISWIALFAAAMLVMAPLTPLPASAETAHATITDATAVLHKLSDLLAKGNSEAADTLSTLGFAEEVQSMKSLDNGKVNLFSPDSMIKSLYQRAEISKAGEGDRFLAVLYAHASTNSAAMASDPELQHLRKFTKADLAAKIAFAPISAIPPLTEGPPLSPAARNAIGKFADFYSGSHFGQARAILLRNLRLDPKVFDAALIESNSTFDALHRMVASYTPPPKVEQTLKDIYLESQADSAALTSDRAAQKIIDDLSRELTPEANRYAEVEDRLPSRLRQSSASALAKVPQAEKRPSDPTVLALLDRETGTADNFTPPSTGGGGGGGSPTPKESYRNYTRNTFVPRGTGGGAGGTPRSYRMAIFSARAARGIAIGGAVTDEVAGVPLRSVWIPNQQDGRFGRLLVEIQRNSDAARTFAVSRLMFADSFYAAASVLWDKRDDSEDDFVDGELLVLMSMDPKALPLESSLAGLTDVQSSILTLLLASPEKAEEILAEISKEDREAIINAIRDEEELTEAQSLVLDYIGRNPDKVTTALQVLSPEDQEHVRRALNSRTRGIVLHPAVHGRELAWSAARVDFSFNDVPLLDSEVRMLDDNKAIPDLLLATPVQKAVTWQFFESDAVVQQKSRGAPYDGLVVVSKRMYDLSDNDRSHFQISMFTSSADDTCKEAVEDGLCRDRELGKAAQPLLDWLATTHPDYIRLNDFSESFSLLRWLRSKSASLDVMDMDGVDGTLGTPDRTVLGYGPQIGSN